MRRCAILAIAAMLAAPTLADDYTKTGPGPVKVFLLIGQSNMNGRGDIATLKNKLIKDLPQQYPPRLLEIRKDVWILGGGGGGISGQKDNVCLEPGFGGQSKWYGPELGFGHRMGDRIKEQILLYKVFGGGTSLGKDWVSSTMSKRTGRPVGHMYKRAVRETIQKCSGLDKFYRDYKPEAGYQLSGIFWCQGNADSGKFAAEYADNLADLICGFREDFGIPGLPFIAVESLSSRTPGEQFIKGCEMANARHGNKQAAAIAAHSKINLRGDDYKPYNASRDSTHWLFNSRAFLDVGYWAADLMAPLLQAETNHAKDAKVQQAWKAVLPLMEEPDEPKK